MLKSRLLVGLFVIVGAAACEKPEPYDAEAQYAKDEERILRWADTSGTALTKDASGLYYEIIENGTGESITERDSLAVFYEGRLLDSANTVFSSSSGETPYRFNLKESIEGWKRGLPLVKGGGQIRLLIPSTMAYKDFPVSNVPLNSPLHFRVEIFEVVKK
ncbi:MULTISPECIES: FKBP-type peptidyl-prolyl cis-trans isomerase [Pedobacter]|uniref:FKBP-type peptidyl-prolyl cis-trans isomerase n=1 Tax=Pedobacter TaxID=84567 RepID=UPI002109B55D|nr:MULTISPECIES: FKBP-type peptidyl-prolyl cis-trans isomerase [unclassified Pedobacter]